MIQNWGNTKSGGTVDPLRVRRRKTFLKIIEIRRGFVTNRNGVDQISRILWKWQGQVKSDWWKSSATVPATSMPAGITAMEKTPAPASGIRDCRIDTWAYASGSWAFRHDWHLQWIAQRKEDLKQGQLLSRQTPRHSQPKTKLSL
jgi:hypothetical protein